LDACKDAAERQRTEAIIKPILRGRDIKRYTYEWKGLWVILAKFGFYKEAHLYPAVVAHLSQYEQALKNRGQCRYGRTGKQSIADYPGQHHWLELDNNPRDEYLAEFEKEKVVWQRITREPTFCLVDSGIYILDSMAFFVSDQYLKYEMAVLNSSTILYYTNKVVHQYGFTGFRLANQYVEVMPIPPITPENQSLVAQIESLVDQILARKRGNPHADTRDLERAIDDIVYRLYDLTPDEIRLVEGM
jgi:type II restriction/modification system DNA methylase subunit YeeA